MKQQLHTTTCHSKPSLRVVKRIEKSTTNMRITHSLIRKLPYWLIFLFVSLSGYAQNWDWAISGGGTYGALGYGFDSEQIFDVKVGTDNNYYFIATIKNGSPQLNGQSVTVYSPNNSIGGGVNNIFIFSTTSTGTVRWSQAIGGGGDNRAYNLVLDSNNNVYVGAFVQGYINYPVHFSPTDSVATSDPDYYKTLYLVKYDSNGVFKSKKALQGGTPTGAFTDGWGQLLDLAIDSQNHLHFIVGLLKGTHLDGKVTVPSKYVYDPVNYQYTTQYHLVEYDTNLDYVNSIVLPIADDTGFPISGFGQRFVFDENLNRYYVAGLRSDGIVSPIVPLTYDGNSFVERTYILAIDGTDGSEVWRREIYSQAASNGALASNQIASMAVDSNSDVYFGGTFRRSYNEQNLKIYDPNNPSATTYTFTPKPYQDLPMVVKFNSSGKVQWVKTPTDFAPNFTSNGRIRPKGLALRQNEVALGSSEAHFIWDGFVPNNPQFYQPEPTLLRFNKQTGKLIGFHNIKGDGSVAQRMTAVAVDNNGNYVVGGSFTSTLFPNSSKITPLVGTGFEDFFVAKLDSPLSTEEFNTITVNVYPNPTTDIINIETEEKIVGYFIYNEDAQKLRAKTQTTNGVQQLNLEGFPTGVYFIALKTESGKSATVKIIKE